MNPNTDFIPFARPTIGKEEEDAVIRILRSGWLTTGSETKAFETEFARFVGVKHALAVNSATAGLHLALEALRVKPGDKVITTPYTFTSTAEIIRYFGADPVFADIEPDSFNISPERIQEAFEKTAGRIAAVLPVHIAGEVCRMKEILEITGAKNVPVVEDAAHSFPSRTKLGIAGTLGELGVYSFYATKTITTGEGGMVVTDNDETAKRIGIMRLHGIDREVWNRYTSVSASWKYGVVEAGFKYNLTDIASALGRVQLRRADEFLDNRSAIAKTYSKAFQEKDYLRVPRPAEGHAWHLYLLQIMEEKLSISRDEFINELQSRGIGTSVHFIPLHLHPYWKDLYNLQPASFPESLKTYSRVISLPIYPSLTQGQRERIMEAVIDIGDSHYIPKRKGL